MPSPSIVERLSRHRTLESAPQAEIEWVAGHSRFRKIGKSGVLTPQEGPVEGLHIILDGHLAIWVDKGAGPRKLMEWRSGDVTGVVPYSRIVAPPADVIAEEPSELVTVSREDLTGMIHACPELTGISVHVLPGGGEDMSVTASGIDDARVRSLRNWTTLVYALHTFSLLTGILGAATIVGAFLTGWPSIIAVILNYARRSEARGTWLESHFRWQIRTFWFGMLWVGLCLAFVVLTLGIGIVIAWLPLLFITVWFIYRIARGWRRLSGHRTMYS